MKTNKLEEITTDEFRLFVRHGLVLIDFYADWCKPCRLMEPILYEVSEKYVRQIRFGKVNIDYSPYLANKYHIKSIPNMIVFKDGSPAEQIIGTLPYRELEKRLLKFI